MSWCLAPQILHKKWRGCKNASSLILAFVTQSLLNVHMNTESRTWWGESHTWGQFVAQSPVPHAYTKSLHVVRQDSGADKMTWNLSGTLILRAAMGRQALALEGMGSSGYENEGLNTKCLRFAPLSLFLRTLAARMMLPSIQMHIFPRTCRERWSHMAKKWKEESSSAPKMIQRAWALVSVYYNQWSRKNCSSHYPSSLQGSHTENHTQELVARGEPCFPQLTAEPAAHDFPWRTPINPRWPT